MSQHPEQSSFVERIKELESRVAQLEYEATLHTQSELQDQLAKIAASVPGLICSFGMRADGSTCMPFATDRIEDLYGLKSAVVREDFSPILSRVHPEDASGLQSGIAESARTMTPWHDVFRYLHPTKGEVWIEGNSMPRREQDGSILWHGFVHDITERKRAELALRESEERFRALFEQAGVGVAEVESATGRFLRINQRYCEIVGYSREEMLHLDFQTLTHPDDLKSDLAQMERLKTGTIHNYILEKRYYRKDGTIVWVALTVSPLWSPGAAPTKHVAVVQDITDRKAAEAKLRESEERLSLFVEHAPAALAMFDRDMRYLAVSRRWISDFQLYDAEIIGKPHYEIFPEIGNDLKDIHRRGLAGEALKGNETRFVRADGSVQYVHWEMYPWNDSNGTIGGIVIFIEDVTDRKHAETALGESKERYRALVETTFDWVWEVDAEGRYTYVSPKIQDLLGYAPEEVLGKTPFDLMPEDEAKRVGVIFGEIAHQRIPFSELENSNRHKDGRLVILETSGIPILGQDGQFNGYRGMDRDITARRKAESERVRLEDQLLQAQKMESVGRLAGGVAHDFNNMLGVILGNAELALAELDSRQPICGNLTEILEAGKRSAELTRQLLAFARKQTISPKVIHLNETIAGMTKMLKRMIGENIGLAFKPAADLWTVRMDPSQIDQILANLCVNARDAIADVGQIVIESENSLLDENFCASRAGAKPGAYVKLIIADDGSGIDKETLDHIFEPFFTTKEVGRGTGLGLATVYGIVRQNEGFIEVESNQGFGTRFSIYLPRHQATDDRTQLEEAPPARLGQVTILVVEDEPSLLKLISAALRKHGCTVIEASAPGDAILRAREYTGKIHLLITDLIMPGMNGRNLAVALQSVYPTIKCLFMSGYTADIIDRHTVLEEGVHFMQKPFSTESLARKVTEVLGK